MYDALLRALAHALHITDPVALVFPPRLSVMPYLLIGTLLGGLWVLMAWEFAPHRSPRPVIPMTIAWLTMLLLWVAGTVGDLHEGASTARALRTAIATPGHTVTLRDTMVVIRVPIARARVTLFGHVVPHDPAASAVTLRMPLRTARAASAALAGSQMASDRALAAQFAVR